MNATFVFKTGIRPLALYLEGQLTVAAKLCGVLGKQRATKARRCGIHRIHTVKNGGKQSSFFAARACADLHHYVLFVVGVAGQQHNGELALELLNKLLCLAQFLVCQRTQFLVTLFEEKKGIVNARLCRFECAVFFNNGCQGFILLCDLRASRRITCYYRIGERGLQVQIFIFGLL